VNNARKWYYWAWGGTWVTGIAAWVCYGMYKTQYDSFSSYYESTLTYDQGFYSDTQRLYYITMGAAITVGVAVAYEIFQIARYLYIATEDATPIVRPAKQEKKQ
jgi:hypothetical protein